MPAFAGCRPPCSFLHNNILRFYKRAYSKWREYKLRSGPQIKGNKDRKTRRVLHVVTDVHDEPSNRSGVEEETNEGESIRTASRRRSEDAGRRVASTASSLPRPVCTQPSGVLSFEE